jgi:hypothetical protein
VWDACIASTAVSPGEGGRGRGSGMLEAEPFNNWFRTREGARGLWLPQTGIHGMHLAQ